ncbi:hypothetical protein NQ317_010263 [Molorchus minor]|uniref:Uncharacterized protein n=1 Tax=Molorchus minor TaxID=1323400 RepID=A0ABQ9JDR5_9CUCU|nr:hypothetical protein NQ317_010263 [Molorchus minor]
MTKSTQSKTTNPDFLKQFEEGDYFLSPSEDNSPFFIQNLRLHGRNKDFTIKKSIKICPVLAKTMY